MKAKVYRENGYFFDAKTGEQIIWRQLETDKMTFGQKLRRFLCRFGRECHRTAVKAAIYMDYTYRREEPPLTAEEMRRLNIHKGEKVMVWGGSRG
ncbi:MAG: hypothetical protein IIX71_08880 [Ruminococcus sp.]|nr:hypothetical protein [Ruminococcus sp.]